jgi:glycosyltransferase involved in cell wall biosynthesis
MVVDDGSSDATAQLVDEQAGRDARIRLARHGANRGYGEALRTGFAAAALDYVFFTDADNQFDMDEIPLLLAWADDRDVVAGYRRQRRDPLMRRINAWGWNRLVRMLFYVPVRDIDCAFKLFRRESLAGIAIESRGAMINTEIIVKLARAGRNVVEVGVDAPSADCRRAVGCEPASHHACVRRGHPDVPGSQQSRCRDNSITT